MSEFKTPRARVAGLGSAKEGVGEWWIGRLTSVALVPLSLAFLCIFAPLIAEPRGELVTALQNPLCAIVAILFLLVAFKHLADGFQEIIVDYVHHKTLLPITLIIVKFGCYALGFAGAFAAARIAFVG